VGGRRLGVKSSRLGVGGVRLEVVCVRLGVGGWRMEVGGSGSEVGGWGSEDGGWGSEVRGSEGGGWRYKEPTSNRSSEMAIGSMRALLMADGRLSPCSTSHAGWSEIIFSSAKGR